MCTALHDEKNARLTDDTIKVHETAAWECDETSGIQR
jgi:hypothetical protein